MVTKILHKSLLRSSILTAASLAFSLEAMAVDVTRDGVSFFLDEAKHEATVTSFILGDVPQKLSKDTIQYEGNVYTVTSIGSFAFVGCENLAEVSFPNVTSIEYSAFEGCSIETITLNQPDPSKVDAEVYKNFGTLSNITLYVPAEA